MDHEQESAAAERGPDTDFEQLPEEPEATSSDVGDDSDAPIRLDDLSAETSETSESSESSETAEDAEQADEAATVAVGPGPETVRAESVTLSQASAQSIEASNVSISQGGAAQVKADTVSVEQGGVAFARTSTLTVSSDASAFAVYAESATIEPDANVFLLITPSANGEVQPVLDWRAALAIGAGFALVVSILRRLR